MVNLFSRFLNLPQLTKKTKATPARPTVTATVTGDVSTSASHSLDAPSATNSTTPATGFLDGSSATGTKTKSTKPLIFLWPDSDSDSSDSSITRNPLAVQDIPNEMDSDSDSDVLRPLLMADADVDDFAISSSSLHSGGTLISTTGHHHHHRRHQHIPRAPITTSSSRSSLNKNPFTTADEEEEEEVCLDVSKMPYDFAPVKDKEIMEWAALEDDYCVPEHKYFRLWVRAQRVVEWRRYRYRSRYRFRERHDDHREFIMVKFHTPKGVRYLSFARRGRDKNTREPIDLVSIAHGWPHRDEARLQDSQEFEFIHDREHHHHHHKKQPDLLDIFLAAEQIHQSISWDKYADRSSHWFAVIFGHVLNGKCESFKSKHRVYKDYGTNRWEMNTLRRSKERERHDVVEDVLEIRGCMARKREELIHTYG